MIFKATTQPVVQPCIYQDTVSMKPMWTNICIICTALFIYFFMTAQMV